MIFGVGCLNCWFTGWIEMPSCLCLDVLNWVSVCGLVFYEWGGWFPVLICGVVIWLVCLARVLVFRGLVGFGWFWLLMLSFGACGLRAGCFS